MQSSKKNTYVFVDIVRPDEEAVRKSDAAARLSAIPMPDRLRETLGKHWVATLNGLRYGDSDTFEAWKSANRVDVFYDKVATRLLRNPPFSSKQQRICFIGDESYWGASENEADDVGNYEDSAAAVDT